MKYRALVFDLDGTLVDSFSAIHAALKAAAASVGTEPWDLATTKKHVGWGLEALVEEAFGPAKKEAALASFLEHYGKIFLSKTYLMPSVSETLPQLADRGYRLAVATNKHASFTERILSRLGIRDYFRAVVGPDASTPPKPHPAMLARVMETLEASPAETLYVGDMPLDVETAARAGVDCLLVATGPYHAEELRGRCAVPVVDRIADIADYLKRTRSDPP